MATPLLKASAMLEELSFTAQHVRRISDNCVYSICLIFDLCQIVMMYFWNRYFRFLEEM